MRCPWFTAEGRVGEGRGGGVRCDGSKKTGLVEGKAQELRSLHGSIQIVGCHVLR